MSKKIRVLSCADATDVGEVPSPRDQSLALIESTGVSWRFDGRSTATHDGTTVIKPAARAVEKPGRWLVVPGGTGSSAGSWGIAYARVAKDADTNDSSEVDTGVAIEEGYEYAFGMKLISHGNADYSDASNTVKVLQALPGVALTVTPTVGGGAAEVDGGVPNPILFENVPASDVNGKQLTFVTGGPNALVAGVGSVVHGVFDFVEDYFLAYLAGQTSYISVKRDGTILAYFGDSGNLGGLDLVFFVARRKVA
jgi:hypothetical protein